MSHRRRLGFVTTHPIQYQVPIFRQLAAMPQIDLTVFFCQLPDEREQGDGFGVDFRWDVPLLDGYRYEVLDNVAREPSVTRFNGCDTPSIGSKLRERRIDAAIVNGWVVKSCMQTLRACRRQRIPCIVRGESNALRPRPWWKQALHRRLLKQYSAFLAIGLSNREFYLAAGVDPESIFPCHYCVDNERFARRAAELEPQRDRLRQQWNIPRGATAFLFSGKLIEKKRPLDLLRALELARRQQADLHALIVGDGELRGECERLAREASLPVTFAGFVNQTEMPAAYVAADCLVLPSDHGETWGLVVNEAMACGRPAVLSDQVGCSLDLIVESETGHVYPCGDAEALARRLVDLARQPVEVRRMGRRAQSHVAAYSVPNAADGIRQAVEYVSARRGAAVA